MAKYHDIPSGDHPIDKIIWDVLAEHESDLLGAPDHRAIARLAAPCVRAAVSRVIAKRTAEGRIIPDEIQRMAGMSTDRLEELCWDRIWASMH